MPTNEELVDAAWKEYLQASITPAEWQKRKDNGYRGKPYDWLRTAYGRGNALLSQIENVATPPPSTISAYGAFAYGSGVYGGV